MYQPNNAPRFALLIGAGDYTKFDASKRSNLPGATQDVASMYALCHVLGIADENIHVLLSPEKSQHPASALLEAYGRAQPGTIGRAKRADILAGFHWLASKLDAAMSASGPAPALVTWSGHGDFLRNELALCPADVASSVDGDDFVNAIGFDELRAFFERPSFANVTLVLDCCHAGGSTDADGVARPSSLSGRAPLSSTNTAPIAARSICATTASGISAQSTFDGVSHGALTWALKVVTDQWSRRRWDNGEEIRVSYGELKHRVNRVLEALSFSQRMQLTGSHVEALPFFHEGALGGDSAPTMPDRTRPGGQLDPGTGWQEYTLAITYDGGSQFTAGLVATKIDAPSCGWTKNNEYIGSMSGTFPPTNSTIESITFTPVDGGKTEPQSSPLTNQVALEYVNYSWKSKGQTNPLPAGAKAYEGPSGVSVDANSSPPSLVFATVASSTPAASPQAWMVGASAPTSFTSTTAPTPGAGEQWYLTSPKNP